MVRAAEGVKLGDHLCAVYERRDEQLAMVAPFVRSGLERGERCLYILGESTKDTLVASLRRGGIDVDATVSRDALHITGGPRSSLRNGVFVPGAMLRLLSDAAASAKASGFTALRVAGEMTWLLRREARIDRLLEYESRVNDFLPKHDMLALCQYHRPRFSPTIIRGVIQTHPQVVFGGPEEFLKPDEEAEIRRLLRALVDRERFVTQLRARNRRLRDLSRQLVTVQETERREVARELHDELGQLLTAVKMILEQSVRSVPGATRRSLRGAASIVADLIKRVRDLSLRLRPTMLDDLGLIPTLRWYLDQYQSQTGVKVDLRFEGAEDRRFSPEIETASYRIVQEALTNVARHAKAGRATVRLRVGADALSIEVEDRGKGIDPDATGGGGLVGMRERAEDLGGRLKIATSPGAGVTVAATLPIMARRPMTRLHEPARARPAAQGPRSEA